MDRRPINHSSHRKESESKRAFEKLVDPAVVNWTVRDYGTDASVQLAEQIDDNGSAKLSSLHFFVQLKSRAIEGTHFLFPAEVSNLISWVKSNVPVALIIYNQNRETFYFKIINQQLISSLTREKPNWSTRKTIGIHFNEQDILERENLNAIKEHLSRISPSKTVLLPGTYFELKKKAKQFIDGFVTISSQAKFESVKKSIDLLSSRLDQALYKVAIVGPSRSGKSTLINCLLKRDISPMGIWQTTGVPIQVIPGSQDQVEIYYTDGRLSRYKFSHQVIEEHVSQAKNKGNEKKVRFLSITVVNEGLEKGISFFDVPGLDDPDDDILVNTAAFVKTFNAVVFVIDVSPAQNGGFLIRSDFKKQINEFSSSLDKVFLVFNKADCLTAEKLAETKTHINSSLEKLSLLKKVDSKVHYLSASESLKHTTNGIQSQYGDELKAFEENIWEFILKGNRSGIHGILNLVKEIAVLIGEFESLLNARLIDSDKIEGLQHSIKDLQKKFPSLRFLIDKRKIEVNRLLKLVVENQMDSLVNEFEKGIRSVPANKELPSRIEIKKTLMDGVQKTIEFGNAEYLRAINSAKEDVDLWIESNLKGIREFLAGNSATRYVDLSSIDQLKVDGLDYSTSFGMGIFGTIVGSFFSGGAALAIGVLSFLAHLVISADELRAKRIVKIIKSTKTKCDDIKSEMLEKYNELTDESLNLIEKYAHEKVSNYLEDLKKQIDAVKTNPLSDQERAVYQKIFSELVDYAKALESFKEELYDYR